MKDSLPQHADGRFVAVTPEPRVPACSRLETSSTHCGKQRGPFLRLGSGVVPNQSDRNGAIIAAMKTLSLFCVVCGVMCLLVACAATRPASINEQCGTVEGWTRLTAPPQEAALLLSLSGGGMGTSKSRLRTHKPAWFQSEEGLVRYCQYSLSTDLCDGPEYVDFRQVNGAWKSEGGGLEFICVDARKRI
jgi:hypothetical protein